MPKPLQQTAAPQAPPCVNAYAKSYCGGNVELQADTNYNIVGKADSAGFIAVFPNGYSRLPSGKLATWNAGNCFRAIAPPKRVLEVPGAYCDTYTQCADGVQVQLCVTDAGGHSWPGVDKVRSGKEAASHALSANDVMWDFFMRVSHP
jgi:hypothetical protein